MVHAEIHAPGHPRAGGVFIKPCGAEETSDSVCHNGFTPEALAAASSACGSQDDCSRAHVCVSCLTAQLEPHGQDISRLSGQTWTQVAGVGSLASS